MSGSRYAQGNALSLTEPSIARMAVVMYVHPHKYGIDSELLHYYYTVVLGLGAN